MVQVTVYTLKPEDGTCDTVTVKDVEFPGEPLFNLDIHTIIAKVAHLMKSKRWLSLACSLGVTFSQDA